MKKAIVVPLLGLLIIGLAGCTQAILGASANERVEKRLPLPKGATFTLENVNGSLTVSLGAEGEVHIVAEKVAKAFDEEKAREYLGKMEVVITTDAEGVKVETKCPKSSQSFFSGVGSGSVAYTVEVPRGSKLKLTTVNGAVKLETPGCDVNCETTNGGVQVSGAGLLDAATVNGAIHFKADGVGDVSTTNGGIEGEVLSLKPGKGHVETVNGGITLSFPASASFSLEAENVNGSVTSSFPGLEASKHSVRGDANGGGQTLTVETVNGHVDILVSK
jgi:hypothetical protein